MRTMELPARLAALLALLALGGCTKTPVRLEVKGPAGTLAARYGVEELPVFEEKGATTKLRAVAYAADDVFIGVADVKWRTEDPTVASVSQSGVLTILSSGRTEVVATTREPPILSDRLEVEAVIVEEVEITKPEVEDGRTPKLPLGEHLRFEAVVRNDRGAVIEDAEVQWESTTYAATIGVNGEAEGRAIGKTTIVASTADGSSDAMEIEVTDWPKGRRRR